MVARFEVDELFIENGDYLALSIGFTSDDDPLDVLHLVLDSTNNSEYSLYLERTDQSASCLNQVRQITFGDTQVALYLTDVGAESLNLERLVEFSFEKQPDLYPIAIAQLRLITCPAHVRFFKE